MTRLQAWLQRLIPIPTWVLLFAGFVMLSPDWLVLTLFIGLVVHGICRLAWIKLTEAKTGRA